MTPMERLLPFSVSRLPSDRSWIVIRMRCFVNIGSETSRICGAVVPGSEYHRVLVRVSCRDSGIDDAIEEAFIRCQPVHSSCWI